MKTHWSSRYGRDMNQGGGIDIFGEMSILKKDRNAPPPLPRGIYSRGGGLHRDNNKGVSTPYLCFDAKCYMLHCTLQQQGLRLKRPSGRKPDQPCIIRAFLLMSTHQSTGAGLRLKAGVEPPAGMWASLPRVPSHTATTLANIKGLLLFLCFTVFLSQRWKSEMQKGAQNTMSTAWLVY